ncbi:MAG: hypothetical protein ABIJ65_03645 [Chloroflexota bacterium]
MLSIKPASEVIIQIEQCSYKVSSTEQADGIHMVDKRKTCSCCNPDCWAILAVAEYLYHGGQRALLTSTICPICGAETIPDKTWDGKYTYEPGWRCREGGLGHFLQMKMARIRRNWQQNPWLIPPADGYAGVRREELFTWQDCLEAERLLQEQAIPMQ